MERGRDGLLHIGGRAHNRLQILITQWMLENVEEARKLPESGGPGTVSEVACRATNAAAESAAHSLEILGLE